MYLFQLKHYCFLKVVLIGQSLFIPIFSISIILCVTFTSGLTDLLNDQFDPKNKLELHHGTEKSQL